MSGHSNWPEWIYIGVVIALMVWVGAEAWEAERLVEHVPADADCRCRDNYSNWPAVVLVF
jgi:cytochrome c oxidase subunit 2